MQDRISLVTLAVADVGVSVAFYRAAFGWEPGFVNDEVAFYNLDGVAFGLWSGMAAELGRSELPPAGSMSLAHNLASPAEVDEAISAAVAGGAEVVTAARTQPWGGYSGHLADPDGHLWEIAFNPDWPLDAAGRPQLPW